MASKALPPDAPQLLSTLDPRDRASLEARLAKAAKACGCTSGTVAVLIATSAAFLWWILYRDGRLLVWPQAGLALVGVLAAAIAGKLAGILFARTWLALVTRRLRRRTSSAALSEGGW